MAAQKFSITELAEGKVVKGGDPLSFVWDAQHRNIPHMPWTFAVEQRTARTDYPGGVLPTEQVLGWSFKPFTLKGAWSDKYNVESFPDGGYAAAEMAEFELLVQRGNPVRIEFEDVIVEGIITNVQFDYRRSWDIGYSFTVSPHHRKPSGFFSQSRSPRKALNAEDLRTETQELLDSMLLANKEAPAEVIAGTVYEDVLVQLNAIERIVGDITETVRGENLGDTSSEPGQELLTIGGLFFSLTTVCTAIRALLKGSKSSTALVYDDVAVYVMSYDVWSKEISYLARRMFLLGRRNAKDIQERVQPRAKRVYRPQKGESFYKISNRFYGSPHSWRLIAEANGISDFILTGEEILVIPDVVGQ